MRRLKRVALASLVSLVVSLGGGYVYFDRKFTPPENALSVSSMATEVPIRWLATNGNPHAALLLPVKLDGIADTFYMQLDLGSPSTVFYGNAIRSVLEQRCARDEIAHLRVDHFAPAPAAEDAVMAGAFDGQVLAGRPRECRCTACARRGLALAGDVVEFAFDRSAAAQRYGSSTGATRSPLDVPQSARQQVVLEHGADGVQVVLGRHVQHGVVFVVELAVRGVVEVALHQVR
jgi:hypothetical protein